MISHRNSLIYENELISTKFFPVFFIIISLLLLIILWNTILNLKTVYILRISSSRSTEWCNFLGSKVFNFPVVKKYNKLKISWIIENLKIFSIYYDFFETRGKSKLFELKISLHFAELDELILKMYTILGLEKVFYKIIEKNWKNSVSK